MHRSKAGLFLVELIILILFFAVAGAICVRLFVTAHLDSMEGENLSQAVLAAQSAAEAYKCTDTTAEAVACLPGARETQEGFDLLYDAQWTPTDDANAAYMVCVRLTWREGVGEAQIDALPYVPYGDRDGQSREPSIYTLTVKKLLD